MVASLFCHSLRLPRSTIESGQELYRAEDADQRSSQAPAIPSHLVSHLPLLFGDDAVHPPWVGVLSIVRAGPLAQP